MELIVSALVPVVFLVPLGYLVYSFQKKKLEEVKKKLEEEKSKAVSPIPSLTTAATDHVSSNINFEQNSEVIEARRKAREILAEAKDAALRTHREAEQETSRLRVDLRELERRLKEEERVFEKKVTEGIRKENDLELTRKRLEEKEKEIEAVRQSQTEQLTKIAQLTKEEARSLVLTNVEKDLTEEIAKRIRQAEEKIKDEASQKAKEILVEAMRHGATDYVAEYTVSVVKLADEEIKGRIIGKEGRNIRTFELLTGVDVDLDEVKEIRISCFDPVRREIARVSLERLITDGRIQPAKIEEIVSKTKNDIERLVHEAGQKLSHDVGVFDLPLEIIDLLGRFRYRFSYGQNMIAHTLEETKIGIKLASEVGADVDVVRRACLLHDIGKVITEDEGTHVQLGADLLRRFKFPEKVINAVYEHHEDKSFSSVESVLVYIADAISGARPGARVEDIEAYVKRMKSLEEVALTFKGVKSVFALSAGREVRVVVEPLEVDDASLVKLAHDIAGKIEKEQTYPGQVKVTVVREVRAFGIAK